MLARSWIAVLLLINYLLVVGSGCMNRPEDQHEFLVVKTQEDGRHYQQCRYLRLDGLEEFLAESLASHYQVSHKTTHHQLITVISGIDAHHPTYSNWLPPAPVSSTIAPVVGNSLAVVTDVHTRVDAPPWLG